MKIAILLPGQPRFTGDINVFLKNVIGYDQADWFVYMTNNNKPQPLLDQNPGVHIGEAWLNYDVDWAIKKIESNLPGNSRVRAFEISDAEEKTWPDVTEHYQCWDHPRVFKMQYNWYKCNQLRLAYEKENNVTYDLVIRSRPEVSVKDPLDVRDYAGLTNSIVMGDTGWHGTPHSASDLIALGDGESITTYCDLVNKLVEYNKSGMHFHPESMLGYHLHVNNIKQIRGRFRTEIREHPLDEFNWGRP